MTKSNCSAAVKSPQQLQLQDKLKTWLKKLLQNFNQWQLHQLQQVRKGSKTN